MNTQQITLHIDYWNNHKLRLQSSMIAVDDIEENFNQAILSNSLFNEKKIIFIRLKKNRLNKDLIASFKSISEANTENLIFIEIQSISKKIILKDILPIFKSNSHIVECSIVSYSNVIDFPRYRRKGITFNYNFSKVSIQFIHSDFKDFRNNSEFFTRKLFF